MSNRRLAWVPLIATSTLCCAIAAASDEHSAGAYAVPRTAAGHPDLEGMWTAGTATPFELPPDAKPGELLTSEQAAAQEKRWDDFVNHRSVPQMDVGHDHEGFMEHGFKVLPTMQPSQVVAPADGRVPLTPEAERRRDFNLTNYDSYDSMSPWDRCITRGPGGLLPAAYNNGYQFVQTATHVVIHMEMIHEARVIPIDGSAHANSRVRSWSGDSRGRWDGTTLVVDTRNFNDKGWLATHLSVGRLRGVPHTENLHVVERFTRTSPDTMKYEFTVEDPAMYTSPWTAVVLFTRDDGYRIYEYACHEGNTATEMILRGARVQEQQAGAARR